MTDIHPRYTIMAVRAVAVLALPAARQIEWLRSLGLGEPGNADEIAEEIGDAALLMPQMVDAGWFSEQAGAVLEEIDGILREWGGDAHEDLWRIEALSTHGEWERLRGLACRFLETI